MNPLDQSDFLRHALANRIGLLADLRIGYDDEITPNAWVFHVENRNRILLYVDFHHDLHTVPAVDILAMVVERCRSELQGRINSYVTRFVTL